jgi:hypothetical protein
VQGDVKHEVVDQQQSHVPTVKITIAEANLLSAASPLKPKEQSPVALEGKIPTAAQSEESIPEMNTSKPLSHEEEVQIFHMELPPDLLDSDYERNDDPDYYEERADMADHSYDREEEARYNLKSDAKKNTSKLQDKKSDNTEREKSNHSNKPVKEKQVVTPTGQPSRRDIGKWKNGIFPPTPINGKSVKLPTPKMEQPAAPSAGSRPGVQPTRR